MSAVYSRYWNAAEHRTTEPTALIARPMPVELAREAFALYMGYPGALSVFCDGRTYRDRVGMARFGVRYARRTGSTEARQPNDGRFTVVNDLSEWMSRHAHEVEKFCMFFDTPEEAQAALPPLLRAGRGRSGAGRTGQHRAHGQGAWTRARPCWRWPTSWASPRGHRCLWRQRERPRHAGKGGHRRRHGQRMPQIKALADLVSTGDCDHDGVAELFERLGL